MPLRHQEFIELCAVCRDPARAGCLRCATPLCERHAPRSGRRCGPCEAAYRDGLLRREAELADRWLAERHIAPITVPVLGLLWLWTAARWLWIRWGQPRRRFLAERRPGAALTAPAAAHGEPAAVARPRRARRRRRSRA